MISSVERTSLSIMLDEHESPRSLIRRLARRGRIAYSTCVRGLTAQVQHSYVYTNEQPDFTHDDESTRRRFVAGRINPRVRDVPDIRFVRVVRREIRLRRSRANSRASRLFREARFKVSMTPTEIDTTRSFVFAGRRAVSPFPLRSHESRCQIVRTPGTEVCALRDTNSPLSKFHWRDANWCSTRPGVRSHRLGDRCSITRTVYRAPTCAQAHVTAHRGAVIKVYTVQLGANMCAVSRRSSRTRG